MEGYAACQSLYLAASSSSRPHTLVASSLRPHTLVAQGAYMQMEGCIALAKGLVEDAVALYHHSALCLVPYAFIHVLYDLIHFA